MHFPGPDSRNANETWVMNKRRDLALVIRVGSFFCLPDSTSASKPPISAHSCTRIRTCAHPTGDEPVDRILMLGHPGSVTRHSGTRYGGMVVVRLFYTQSPARLHWCPDDGLIHLFVIVNFLMAPVLLQQTPMPIGPGSPAECSWFRFWRRCFFGHRSALPSIRPDFAPH